MLIVWLQQQLIIQLAVQIAGQVCWQLSRADFSLFAFCLLKWWNFPVRSQKHSNRLLGKIPAVLQSTVMSLFSPHTYTETSHHIHNTALQKNIHFKYAIKKHKERNGNGNKITNPTTLLKGVSSEKLISWNILCFHIVDELNLEVTFSRSNREDNRWRPLWLNAAILTIR